MVSTTWNRVVFCTLSLSHETPGTVKITTKANKRDLFSWNGESGVDKKMGIV